MSSPCNAIVHILESQDSKEVTANEAFDRLDTLMNGTLDLALPSDADHTLSTSPGGESDFFRLNITGTTTADRAIILSRKHQLIVKNATTGGHNLVVKMATGATVTVANGASHLLYCTGADVIDIATLP